MQFIVKMFVVKMSKVRGTTVILKFSFSSISFYSRNTLFFLPKALYITGKEVFNFRMISYVNATDGIAYTNMDVVDNRIYLTVGCIQVVFVNKFVSSILVR